MVFSSVIFLFLFLPIVLGCYYLLPGREAKNLWLVAASLLFYAFSGLWYVLLLLFSVFCNYLAGLFVSGRKSVLYAAVAVNLGILGIFKYLTFLVQTVDRLPGVTIPVPSIVLPMGISFFTFQGLSYVIDVYRNERLKSTHFRDVLLYIALFPQLVAGPIIRYEDVADEIHSRRNTLEQLAKGLRRFIVGLSKKLLIADICGNVVALIYNADRHAGNFGVLRDVDTGKVLGLAPNYDNNLSLLALHIPNEQAGADFLKDWQNLMLFHHVPIQLPPLAPGQLGRMAGAIRCDVDKEKAVAFLQYRYDHMQQAIERNLSLNPIPPIEL